MSAEGGKTQRSRKKREPRGGRTSRPKLAVWKFASCDGCQLTLLNCEDELLALAGEVEIAYFLEASRATVRGPYDLSLVEGSITTPRDAARIQEVRKASEQLVTLGACATAGGIQALRNFADVDDFIARVYASPEHIDTLARSTPISDHVRVDFELRGCPIDKAQLLELLTATLAGRRPEIPTTSVCTECKGRGLTCVMVAGGVPCLGPVTQAGCGALCPSCHRGCYGCFGPKEAPNPGSLSRWWLERGEDRERLIRLFRTYNAWADPFRKESEAHEQGRRHQPGPEAHPRRHPRPPSRRGAELPTTAETGSGSTA